MFGHAVRLAAATLTVAAAGVVLPASAQASTCGTGTGVSVVVDFHQLGGGVQAFCDADGAGQYADVQFEDAGHELAYVQGQAFVCRVDTEPDSTCVRTPPANAYWSLWWSDGKSGTWKYSSVGVKALKVPDGGAVALSWQGQSAQARPRVSPPGQDSASPSTSASPHPTSSPRPSTGPGQAPASSAPGSTTSSPGSSTGMPTAIGQGRRHLHPSKSGRGPGKASHGPDETQAGEPTDRADASSRNTGDSGGPGGSGGLPGWVAPVVVVVLFLGAGAIALVRRKSSGGA